MRRPRHADEAEREGGRGGKGRARAGDARPWHPAETASSRLSTLTGARTAVGGLLLPHCRRAPRCPGSTDRWTGTTNVEFPPAGVRAAGSGPGWEKARATAGRATGASGGGRGGGLAAGRGGRSCVHVGRAKSHAGRSTSHAGPAASHVGASKSHVGRSRSHVGASTSHVGASKSHANCSAREARASRASLEFAIGIRKWASGLPGTGETEGGGRARTGG